MLNKLGTILGIIISIFTLVGIFHTIIKPLIKMCDNNILFKKVNKLIPNPNNEFRLNFNPTKSGAKKRLHLKSMEKLGKEEMTMNITGD